MTFRGGLKTSTAFPLRVSAFYLLAGLISVVMAPFAEAGPDEETAGGASDRIYDAAFFASFSPQSALDMVDQTPGFAIKEGGGKRGMGAGEANVLIDNRRVPVKSMTVREALSRIDAGRVVRIEIVDGADLKVPGLSGQVVNVITRDADLSARWELSPEFREGSDARLERGRLVVSGTIEDWQYSASFSSYAWNGRSQGPETLFDSAGEEVEFRKETDRSKGRRYETSTALEHRGESGDISHIGFALASSKDAANEVSLRSARLTNDHIRDYAYAAEATSLKVNADHEFGLGRGRLKLIGLRSEVSGERADTTLIERLQSLASGARVNVDRSSGESILRSEYTWIADGDWQMALEGAVNTQQTKTAYAQLVNGEFAYESLVGGTSEVQERRAEAAIIHGRILAEGVFLQASIAAEQSEIAQSGPTGKVRAFVRPKGYVALSWSPIEHWEANLRVERAVGQLDFGDFISSVNLADETGQQSSGNPQIVPEQSWDLALEANGDVGGLGPVRVKLYGRQIEDVNSSILFSRTVSDTGQIFVVQGPGNLGHAASYGLDLSGTLPTPLGIQGGKLDWTASFRDSSVDDAVTGERRHLSGTRHSFYALNFRQDLSGTPWAWGFSFEDGHNAPGFGVTQVTRSSDSAGRLGAFVQHKDLAGMKARLSVSNLLDTHSRVIRVGYAGTVADPVSSIEDRTRTQGLQMGLSLAGSF